MVARRVASYGGITNRENGMRILTDLLTTDVGLLSFGVILFMVVMGIYIGLRLRRLMHEEPGKKGWQ